LLILSEFDIQFRLAAPAAMVAMLHLHPSLEPLLRSGDQLLIESLDDPFNQSPASIDYTKSIVPSRDYLDGFGNRCTRFVAPAGYLWLSGNNIIDASPEPDTIYPDAQQSPVKELPAEVLQFLLPSRYCQVDQFGAIAQDLFFSYPEGWQRAVAIRDWVNERVSFNYNAARPTKTALDVFTERVGVCRDFQHLAITLTRCQNIPARYVTGYIGDIRRPSSGLGDFSAWYQVFSTANGLTWTRATTIADLEGSSWLQGATQPMSPSPPASAPPTSPVSMWSPLRSMVKAIGARHRPPRHRKPWPFVNLQRISTPTQTNNSESSPTQIQAATL